MDLTVHFTGICTHTKLVGKYPHRVVLVRADHGGFINDAPLPPHIPLLKIDPAQIAGIDGSLDGLLQVDAGVWRLCGVRLSLGGTTEPSFKRRISDVPHLGVEESSKSEIPKVSGEVVGNYQAACYFDLDKGRLTTRTTRYGAIMSKLRVETGDKPKLQVQCFWNRQPSAIRLVPGATIEIEHVGSTRGDSAKDFLLHYRIFEWVHPDAVIPPEAKAKANLNLGGVTIGCSNSQYP